MSKKIKIGTVGIGLMGSSIATCLLASGHFVTALTNNIREKEGAIKRIDEFLQQLKAEELIDEEPAEVLKKLHITDQYSALKDHAVVIESVVENITEKRKVFAQLETVLTPDTLIGSNTSAIPVTLLQAEMQNPQRLFGIHWAEPAHLTRFMEIICGDQSDIQLAEKFSRLAESWGKEPSLIRKDIRGFIANRVMYAMLREAFYLVENGYATIEDVDRSLRNDLGYWITFAGPFRFMDLTGIPAYLAVMNDLFPDLCNDTKVPATIERLVKEGGKGVRNQQGFYTYSEDTARHWEKLFMEFSFEIRKLAGKYPQDAGEHI
ncbi:MAG: 3-hydroxyacyl-CoA dehydrogenase family protein [Saprospiraceae bacterium]|nr:3-hydroxyacyl-CoA dehydrogenase family protein [Saprospiraceae bacterium]